MNVAVGHESGITKYRTMIEYIKGELTDLTPALAVLEAAGVGYALNISLNTFTAIQGKKDVRLYVHEALVSGVGANTARMILSTRSPAELGSAIATGNERLITSVKGKGLKTAQRIIVDLRDKILSLGMATEEKSDVAAAVVNVEVRDEAVSALTMLGFSPAPSAKVVVTILEEHPDMPVEQVVKLALKQIK